MSRSLRARLAVASACVLVTFLGATGLALDRAFRDSGLAQVAERLQAHVYGLLAAADPAEDGLALPEALPDERLSLPDSGLYAQVSTDGPTGAARILWRSGSLLGRRPDFPLAPQAGVPVFAEILDGDGGLYALSFRVIWELEPGDDRGYVLSVAEDRGGFAEERRRFGRSLWLWLAAAAVLLLAVQGWVLRWGLAPLRAVKAGLDDVRAGRRARLEGPYPLELTPLTESLNELLVASERRLERQRNALADLAHSLKTPLAVIHATVDGNDDAAAGAVREQVGVMDRAVGYQLRRAAGSGRSGLAPLVCVAPVLARLRSALVKVYADKALEIRLEVPEDLTFNGDEGDLTEVGGNLMDNACKWARSRVSVRAERCRETGALRISVDDDGPGIPEHRADELLERGARVDANVPGQGIGLAVVRELVVDLYGGRLAIQRSPEGGARAAVELP